MTIDRTGKIVSFTPDVPDLDAYNREMGKGIIDKIFFMDVIDADLIVDYGCANGAMLGALHRLFPNKSYLGYDVSVEEIERATEAHPKEISFTNNWSFVSTEARLARTSGRTVSVVCNSLVHEVMSYSNPEEIEEFFARIFDLSTFMWVVMRDMCASHTINRPSDPISVAKVRQRHDPVMIAEFEQQWGNFESNWSFVHFLLKYRYKANWSRELLENYLPINLEALLARVPNEWTPVLVDHFTHPFTRQQVMKDFGVDLQDRTHLKLILKSRP